MTNFGVSLMDQDPTKNSKGDPDHWGKCKRLFCFFFEFFKSFLYDSKKRLKNIDIFLIALNHLKIKQKQTFEKFYSLYPRIRSVIF